MIYITVIYVKKKIAARRIFLSQSDGYLLSDGLLPADLLLGIGLAFSGYYLIL